jgi:AraC-like DNA-binding protein
MTRVIERGSGLRQLRARIHTRIVTSMGLIHQVTCRPLCEFVDSLWLSENYVQPHAAERVLPTGNAVLILNLDEFGRADGDVLSGARTRSFVLDTSRPLSLIGVSFKPAGSFPFSGGHAGELQDLSIPLDLLWGRSAHVLREQLLEAATASAKFEILERFLCCQVLRSRPPGHPAIRYAVDVFQKKAGAVRVSSVSNRVGLSDRRFIELFRREVGMTPKLYCRVSRFRAVVSSLGSTMAVDWAGIAAACGYYDQAHLIHDFREFAGVSPSAYLTHRTAGPNHVRVVE